MSWYRLLAAAAVCLITAACGFQPLYGDRGGSASLAAQLASIRVVQITERYGQVMTNDLHDGLNPTALSVPTVYQLEVALHETTAPQATRADGTPSRSALALSATWLLRKLGDDNKVVTHGSLKSSTGYDVLNNDYANVVSNNTGELRAVRDLSDQIQASLAIYFQTQPTT
jgi:LPS-assembly lipoprotein